MFVGQSARGNETTSRGSKRTPLALLINFAAVPCVFHCLSVPHPHTMPRMVGDQPSATTAAPCVFTASRCLIRCFHCRSQQAEASGSSCWVSKTVHLCNKSTVSAVFPSRCLRQCLPLRPVHLSGRLEEEARQHRLPVLRVETGGSLHAARRCTDLAMCHDDDDDDEDCAMMMMMMMMITMRSVP